MSEFEDATWALLIGQGVTLIHGEKGRKAWPTISAKIATELVGNAKTKAQMEPYIRQLFNGIGLDPDDTSGKPYKFRTMRKLIESCAKCRAKINTAEPHAALMLAQGTDGGELLMDFEIGLFCQPCSVDVAPRLIALAQFIGSQDPSREPAKH